MLKMTRLIIFPLLEMEFSLLVVVKEYLIDHETFFLKIALAIAEACLSSTKKLLKCKVHIFLDVPSASLITPTVYIIIVGLVKSLKMLFSVIPAKAGIQSFQIVINSLDSGFHRSDAFLRVHHS
jgi:hypothetical protein